MYTPATLSADTLFHFTKSQDDLISILTNEFEPRYCIENLGFQTENQENLAIPMVCFCDLPLSQ
ncbi:MAG: hypothetical protein COS88_01980 [Chloroflexi bacterium CG07_land_8_20_14_0_80_51_10]|nr:MAG: hypothetical protein COS88_01980 [Chloroflexi bacterium CG07_land_8_20_14_0_80_51_10]